MSKNGNSQYLTQNCWYKNIFENPTAKKML